VEGQDKAGMEETEEENRQQQQSKDQAGQAVQAKQGAKPENSPQEELDVDIQELENAIPKPDYRPPPVAPREPNGTGSNKRVYFVCHQPGQPWIRLPPVTPAQISSARIIRKFFTGNLDSPVISYPPFPGLEINYLRAQIARISAGTQISPQGFYQFNEEEEEEEEGAVRENFIENAEYESMPLSELVDSSLASWVHSTLHILPQGRCQWWNPALAKRAEAGDGESDEGDEEQEEEQPDEPEPETGPPLLTPLSEDVEVDAMTPWTARVSSALVPHYAVAVVSSNLWPGAHAFGLDKMFENLYIGWGLKYSSENHSPVAPSVVQHEFPSGPETTEVEDPTPEEEAAFRAAQAEAHEAEEAEEENEEEEEEDED
jgi:radial spoke head protein 4/6